MIRLIKVAGESLSPFFSSGDYALVINLPFSLLRLKTGDWVVFRHPIYGRLIKRLESFHNGGDELFVMGFHPESTDSRMFGLIPRKWVSGKVIAHIKKPTKEL